MRRLIWLVCAAAGLCVAVVLIQKFLLGKEEAQQLTAEKVQKQDERAAPSLPGNEQGWIGMGSIPGLHNSLGSIVAHGNTVYAAGTFAFVSAGVQSVKENDKGGSIVVAWNGKEWRSLMRTCDGGYVKALAVTPNGHLYAAGAVCVNGVRVSIGKWDGENWVSVGQGLGNDVHALHVDKQGGLFATGSGATWKWDGVVWRKLGGDIRGRSAGGNAITSDNLGRIYVAGSFDGVGPAKAHNIAIWDGNKWRAIGRGVGGRGGDRGEGGDDGTDQSSAWSIAMSSKSDLYVVSSLGLERWKGNAWELVDIGTEAIANTVFIDKDDRIYVGLVSTCNVEGGPSVGTDKPVQYWDGLKWSSFTLRGSNSGDAPGCDNGGTVSAISGDESGNLYFGGAFADRNSGARNIAKWNGKTLERFGDSKGVNNIVWGLVADRDDNLYAHGAFTRVDEIPVQENQIIKWHSGKWEALKALDFPIRAMALDPMGVLYVAAAKESEQYSRLLKWDGENWNQVTSIGYLIRQFVVDEEGKIFSCGLTGDEGDHYGSLDYHGFDFWDGKKWERLPENGVKADYQCGIKIIEPKVIHVQHDSGVWRWDGKSWAKEENAEKISALVRDPQGRLYSVIREDYDAGRNIINTWEAGKTGSLGATSFGGIYSMAASKNYLYIGGAFSVIDETPSPYLARIKIGGGLQDSMSSGR